MKHIKQISTAVALITGVSLSSIANADTVLGGYVGAQAWNMSTEGGFSQNDSNAEFMFDDETIASFYAALEHPIPFVPNIKLSRTNLETTGNTVIDSTFTFGGEVYLVNANLETTIDLTTTDYILYYEILDNDLITFDIGVAGKHLDGMISVMDQDGRASAEDLSVVIPMGYAKAHVGLPLTGLTVFAEGTLLAIGDDSFSDYQVGIAYDFYESFAIDLHLLAGYRATELDINDVDDIYADITFDGAFVGLEFDF